MSPKGRVVLHLFPQINGFLKSSTKVNMLGKRYNEFQRNCYFSLLNKWKSSQNIIYSVTTSSLNLILHLLILKDFELASETLKLTFNLEMEILLNALQCQGKKRQMFSQ